MDRARLLSLALTALEEVTERRRAGPIGRPVSLRFLLAYLHFEGGDRIKRDVVDRFWTLAVAEEASAYDVDVLCTHICWALGRKRMHPDKVLLGGRERKRFKFKPPSRGGEAK